MCLYCANEILKLYIPIYSLFYVEPDRFVVRDVFLSVFSGSVVTIKMGMEHTFASRRFDLFGPSSVVVCACSMVK